MEREACPLPGSTLGWPHVHDLPRRAERGVAGDTAVAGQGPSAGGCVGAVGEPFDFLTWFEFAPEHATAFEELVAMLRATEEWSFVEREVDVRLMRED